MIQQIENKDILSEINRFLESRETVFMDKQFDSLCKIHNPFGFIESGDIYAAEDSIPDSIHELDWKDFIDKYGLNISVDSNTSMEQIHKTFIEKFGNQEFLNFYWASGSLGRKQIDILIDILKEIYKSGTLYCYYSLITNLYYKNPEEEIYRTDFNDLKQLIKNKRTFTPTIWWDKEINWIVYTDSDLSSTYVLGDKVLIDKICVDTELDSYKFDIKDYSKDFDKSILK
jgi:hypothetical protein